VSSKEDASSLKQLLEMPTLQTLLMFHVEIDTAIASDIVCQGIRASPANHMIFGKVEINRKSDWTPVQSDVALVKLSDHDGNAFLESCGQALIGVRSIENVDAFVFDNQAAPTILGPWDVCEMKLTIQKWTETVESALAAHVSSNKKLRKLSLRVQEIKSGRPIYSTALLKAFGTVDSLLIDCEFLEPWGYLYRRRIRHTWDPVWRNQVQRVFAGNRMRNEVVPSLLEVESQVKSVSTRVLGFLLDLPIVDNSMFFEFLRRNKWHERDAILASRKALNEEKIAEVKAKYQAQIDIVTQQLHTVTQDK
jgi:hypothetical protein